MGAKWEELERVVGKSVREEEPEGEDLAEEEGSGNYLHNKLISLPQFVLVQILMSPFFLSFFQQLSEFSYMFGLVSPIYESDEEVALRPETEEE